MSPRITVPLDDDLYARLLVFAKGRSQGHTPNLSAIVREALEQYLAPLSRQSDTLSETKRLTRAKTKKDAHNV